MPTASRRRNQARERDRRLQRRSSTRSISSQSTSSRSASRRSTSNRSASAWTVSWRSEEGALGDDSDDVGRSASGRSASGRTASSRSASDRSASGRSGPVSLAWSASTWAVSWRSEKGALGDDTDDIGVERLRLADVSKTNTTTETFKQKLTRKWEQVKPKRNRNEKSNSQRDGEVEFEEKKFAPKPKTTRPVEPRSASRPAKGGTRRADEDRFRRTKDRGLRREPARRRITPTAEEACRVVSWGDLDGVSVSARRGSNASQPSWGDLYF